MYHYIVIHGAIDYTSYVDRWSPIRELVSAYGAYYQSSRVTDCPAAIAPRQATNLVFLISQFWY